MKGYGDTPLYYKKQCKEAFRRGLPDTAKYFYKEYKRVGGKLTYNQIIKSK
jgi:hypothetical protein